MIYDDKMLQKLTKTQLKEHEKKLIKELHTNIDYWLNSYDDNIVWAYKVSTTVECLKQIRKHIKN